MNTILKLILVIRTIVNFPTAILDKLGFLKGEVVYKIRSKNTSFIARAGTEDMAEIVIVGSGHEYDTKLINLPKQPVIVDLGGHIGTFSIYMAQILKDKCKIYAYEPDKKNYAILNRNIALNKIRSVSTANIAISDHTGKGYLKTEDMNTDAYRLESMKGKKPNCQLSTLSSALHKYKIKKVDLLKIDIEGAEYDIFLHKESFDYIKSTVHYIFMEHHDLDNKHNYSLIKKKVENSFEVLKHQKNVIILENSNWKYD